MYYLIPLLVINYIIINNKNVNYKILLRNVILILLPIVLTLGPTHYRNYRLYRTFAFTSQCGGHTMGFLVPQIYQSSGMGSYQEGLDTGSNLPAELCGREPAPAKTGRASVAGVKRLQHDKWSSLVTEPCMRCPL